MTARASTTRFEPIVRTNEDHAGMNSRLPIGLRRSSFVARAKVRRGCFVIRKGFEYDLLRAKLPAIIAEARDSRARRRFFSSSTKTKSPADANGYSQYFHLNRPVSDDLSSDRIGDRAYLHCTFLYVCAGKEKQGTRMLPGTTPFLHGKENILDRIYVTRTGGGFHAADLVGVGVNNSNLVFELVGRVSE